LLLVDSVSFSFADLFIDGVAHSFICCGALLLGDGLGDCATLLIIAAPAFLLKSYMTPFIKNSVALRLSATATHFFNHIGAHPLGSIGALLFIYNIDDCCALLLFAFFAYFLKLNCALFIIDN